MFVVRRHAADGNDTRHPITLDVSPGIDGNRLYVGALGRPGEPNFIQVLDTFTRTEVASVGVAAPSALVADPVDNAAPRSAIGPISPSGEKGCSDFDDYLPPISHLRR